MEQEEVDEMVESVREGVRQSGNLEEMEKQLSKLSEQERRRLAGDLAFNAVLLTGVDRKTRIVETLKMQVENRFKDVVVMPSGPISPFTVYMDVKTAHTYLGPRQYFILSQGGER